MFGTYCASFIVLFNDISLLHNTLEDLRLLSTPSAKSTILVWYTISPRKGRNRLDTSSNPVPMPEGYRSCPPLLLSQVRSLLVDLKLVEDPLCLGFPSELVIQEVPSHN